MKPLICLLLPTLFACAQTGVVDPFPPDIELRTPTLDFGEVEVGTRAQAEMILAAAGSGPTEGRVRLAASSDGFEVEPRSFRLTPGQSLVVPVAFVPLHEGAHAGAVLVEGGVGGPREVPLFGTARTPPPELRPESLDFGAAQLGAQRILELSVRNPGQAPMRLRLGPNSEIGRCGASDTPFCWVEGLTEEALAPGATRILELGFIPRSSGPVVGGLELVSCARPECRAQVALQGVGFERELECSEGRLDFGRVRLGGTEQRTLVCRNATVEPLMLTGWSLRSDAADFSVPEPEPVELGAGERFELPVGYTPSVEGEVSSAIYLGYHPSGASMQTAEVALGARAVDVALEVEPEVLSFGAVSLIAPAYRMLTVTNRGTSPIRLSGMLASPSVRVEGVPSTSIDPGASVELKVGLQPDAVGPVETELQLVTDDSALPTVAVQLDGEGVNLPPCRFEVHPAPLSFGTVLRTRVFGRSVEVRNTGSGDCLLTSARWVGAAPGFRIVQPELHSMFIPSGQSGFVELEMAPEALGPVAARLRLGLSNPQHPEVDVEVGGVGADTALALYPQEIRFGARSPGCGSQPETLAIENRGETPVSLTRLDLVGGGGRFRVEGVPSLPRALGPGALVLLQVTYEASPTVGPFEGALEIETSAPGHVEHRVVRLSGATTAGAMHRERFRQAGGSAADIVLVMNAGWSLHEERASLGATLDRLTTLADRHAVDYRIGVVSADHAGGRFASAPTGTEHLSAWWGPSDLRVVTRASLPSPTAVLASNATLQRAGGAVPSFLLASAHRALEPSRLLGHNAGFRRPSAHLGYLLVHDVPDYADTLLAAHLRTLRSTVRDPNRVSLSAVAAPYPSGSCSGPEGHAQSSGRTQAAAHALGGVFVSICSADWPAIVDAVAPGLLGHRERFVLGNPAAADTVRVWVDGVETPAVGPSGQPTWRYVPEERAVRFESEAVPGWGASVEVRYSSPCL